MVLRAACSRTARPPSRVTPGNHSTHCDTSAPSSRFSNNAAIGTRVPRNTQAPLTRSGSRSTAGQEDQSIMAKCYHGWMKTADAELTGAARLYRAAPVERRASLSKDDLEPSDFFSGLDPLEQLLAAQLDFEPAVVHEDVGRGEGVAEVFRNEGAGAHRVQRCARVGEHLALEHVEPRGADDTAGIET